MSNEESKLRKIAILVSVAAILQVAESFFPQIVPGVKLGLANMVVLIALVNIGFAAAIEIAIMRTLISSLILGTFLSPGFILSFASAIASTLVMAGLYRLSMKGKRVFLSLIGISIAGAITHNLTQLSLVYLLLIKNTGVFLLLPWLGISSVITGWATGVIASQACIRLGRKRAASFKFLPEAGPDNSRGFTIGRYMKKDSPIHSMAPEIKIFSIFALALLVIAVNSVYGYTAVLAGLMAAALVSKIPLARFFDGVKRLYFFIILSFALPVIFTTGGHSVFTAGIINVTREGISSGLLFAFRLVLLMTGAAVLIRTTSPAELAEGIRKLLKPFAVIGISGDRISRIVTSSLLAIPAFWEDARRYISNYKMGKKKVKGLILALSSLIVMLYLKSEDESLKII